jgi:DNA-binding MarR family transcriptional regulator
MSRPDPERRLRLGALLRLAHSMMTERYAHWLESSAYRDLQPAHAAAIQPLWQLPDGLRLTALAQAARITKQSMGALVDSLERDGYVERVEDPDDGRASRIRLTARGRRYVKDARAWALELERELSGRIGTRRLEELRTTLELLIG